MINSMHLLHRVRMGGYGVCGINNRMYSRDVAVFALLDVFNAFLIENHWSVVFCQEGSVGGCGCCLELVKRLFLDSSLIRLIDGNMRNLELADRQLVSFSMKVPRGILGLILFMFHALSLSAVIERYSLDSHFYADDGVNLTIQSSRRRSRICCPSSWPATTISLAVCFNRF
jgi:hypothetical protein